MNEDWEDCLGDIYEAMDIDYPSPEEIEEMNKYFAKENAA